MGKRTFLLGSLQKTEKNEKNYGKNLKILEFYSILWNCGGLLSLLYIKQKQGADYERLIRPQRERAAHR